MVRIIITGFVLSMLLFGYEPIPAPPVDPNDASFIFDHNQCPSEPMIALVIQVGSTHTGEIKVTEPDGDEAQMELSGCGNNFIYREMWIKWSRLRRCVFYLVFPGQKLMVG